LEECVNVGLGPFLLPTIGLIALIIFLALAPYVFIIWRSRIRLPPFRRSFEEKIGHRIMPEVIIGLKFLELGYLFGDFAGMIQAALYSLINSGYIKVERHTVKGAEGCYRTLRLARGAIETQSFALKEGALEPLELEILQFMENRQITMRDTPISYEVILQHISGRRDAYDGPCGEISRKLLASGLMYEPQVHHQYLETLKTFHREEKWAFWGIVAFYLLIALAFIPLSIFVNRYFLYYGLFFGIVFVITLAVANIYRPEPENMSITVSQRGLDFVRANLSSASTIERALPAMVSDLLEQPNERRSACG
jgi:hypothetical protein